MQHLALIMDGNRRWARRNGFELFAASRDDDKVGEIQAFEAAIDCCLRRKIPHLTVYALSIENLKRSDGALQRLYSSLNRRGDALAKKLVERDVEMRFVGDRSLFDPSVADVIDHIESATKGNTALKIMALFCYGGQQEIVAATRALAQKIASGELAPEDVNAQVFERAMWTAGTPPPDLIIRTGGFVRLSNFLTYHAAYAEYTFLDILWPDLTAEILNKAIDDYANVTRTFGA